MKSATTAATKAPAKKTTKSATTSKGATVKTAPKKTSKTAAAPKVPKKKKEPTPQAAAPAPEPQVTTNPTVEVKDLPLVTSGAKLDTTEVSKLEPGAAVLAECYDNSGFSVTCARVLELHIPKRKKGDEHLKGTIKLKTFPVNQPSSFLSLRIDDRLLLGPRDSKYQLRFPNLKEASSFERVEGKSSKLQTDAVKSGSERAAKRAASAKDSTNKKFKSKFDRNAKIVILKTDCKYRGSRLEKFKKMQNGMTVQDYMVLIKADLNQSGSGAIKRALKDELIKLEA